MTEAAARHRTKVPPRPDRGVRMPWVLGTSPVPDPPAELALECLERVQESPSIVSFTMRRRDGKPLAFRSGQYLSISVPAGPDGTPCERNYSISSSPLDCSVVRISVKREPQGLVSSWIHENLRPGMTVDALGPLGDFYPADVERRARFLLLAGGVGITPIASILWTLHKADGAASIDLIHHASRPEEFALSGELLDIAERDPRVRVHLSLGDRPCETWEGLAGRLDAEVIESLVPDACGRQVFACGPPGYLEAAKSVVVSLGVSPNSFFTESFLDTVQTGELEEEGAVAPAVWDTEAVPEAEVADAVDDIDGLPGRDPDDPRPAVTFVRTGVRVMAEEGETILQAATREGITLRSNCANGMCGTCKVRTLAGDVDMRHNGGIRRREVEDGIILACCSRPEGDVVIDA